MIQKLFGAKRCHSDPHIDIVYLLIYSDELFFSNTEKEYGGKGLYFDVILVMCLMVQFSRRSTAYEDFPGDLHH